MATPTTRILWLSDIHFRDCYKDNTIVKGFIQAFLDRIETDFPAANPDKKIDYIYLGGDIAYSGQTKEYDAFNTVILDKLMTATNLKVENVISVAGNHDVDWEEILQIFTTQGNELEKNLKDKNQFLKNNEADFKRLFTNYAEYFATLARPKKKYEDHRLFGHKIDKKRKIIFFFFNTAWFSVSSKIDDLMLNVKSIEDILKIKKHTNEFGGQIVGQALMQVDAINEIIDSSEYKDFVKITCLHHPLHWLNWGEIYNYTDNQNRNSLLKKILDASDLTLTGHEHVPIYVKPKQTENGNWHIEAGMFLEDDARHGNQQAEMDNLFPHNRFSVLEIGADQIRELRYKYNKLNTSWKCETGHDHTLPLKPKIVKPLTKKDLEKKKIDFYAAIRK